MDIKQLNAHTLKKWDTFLAAVPEHSFFHLLSWFNVLTDVYHHQLFLPAAIGEAEEVTGGFPLFLIKNPIAGSKLISIPYQTDVGGPLSDNLEIRRSLIASAINLGIERRVRYIEIRGRHSGAGSLELGFQKHDVSASLTCTHLKNITLTKIRKNHQRDIHKARKHHVEIMDAETLNQWKLFYALFEKQQRQFAAPGFGWKFFQLLYDRLREKVKIRLAWVDKQCVGGILLFHHNTTVYYKQGVIVEEFKKTGAGKLMMWDSMMWAKECGYDVFNFGMSLDANRPLIHYKEGFKGVTVPVENYIYPIKGMPPKIEDLDSGYTVLKSIWQRMPLFVTKRAGALLSRWYC